MRFISLYWIAHNAKNKHRSITFPMSEFKNTSLNKKTILLHFNTFNLYEFEYKDANFAHKKYRKLMTDIDDGRTTVNFVHESYENLTEPTDDPCIEDL